MPERVVERPIDELIDEIDAKLRQFKIDYRGMTLREKVRTLAGLAYDGRCLNVSAVCLHDYDANAAISRLRQYLIEHVLVVLEGSELDVVAGISEYARRIRQLRVEEGYRILTGASPDASFSELSLKPDQYILIDVTPDVSAARRWLVANRIRKDRISVRDKILKFLLENVGQVVTTEELAYVAGGKMEFAKRVRELRTEEGYAVATKVTGRPDLRIGEYVLLSADRIAVPHDRHIDIETQKAVYRRDNNMCRACGWTIASYSIGDPRILEIHHLQEHVDHVPNTVANLIVLCSRCHDKVHAGTLDISHITNG